MIKRIFFCLFFMYPVNCFLTSDVSAVFPTWADYMKALLDLKSSDKVYEQAFERCGKLPYFQQTGEFCEDSVLDGLGITDKLKQYLCDKYYNKNI